MLTLTDITSRTKLFKQQQKDVIKLSQEDWLGVSKQLRKEEMEIGK
jgi:hypothetical protein